MFDRVFFKFLKLGCSTPESSHTFALIKSRSSDITYKKLHHNEKTFYKFSEVNAELLKKMIAPYMFECDLDFDKKIEQEKRFIYCEKNIYQIENLKLIHFFIKYFTQM